MGEPLPLPFKGNSSIFLCLLFIQSSQSLTKSPLIHLVPLFPPFTLSLINRLHFLFLFRLTPLFLLQLLLFQRILILLLLLSFSSSFIQSSSDFTSSFLHLISLPPSCSLIFIFFFFSYSISRSSSSSSSFPPNLSYFHILLLNPLIFPSCFYVASSFFSFSISSLPFCPHSLSSSTNISSHLHSSFPVSSIILLLFLLLPLLASSSYFLLPLLFLHLFNVHLLLRSTSSSFSSSSSFFSSFSFSFSSSFSSSFSFSLS